VTPAQQLEQALSLVRMRQYDAAIATFERLHASQPRMAEAWFQRSDLEVRLGRPHAAIGHAAKAVAASPGTAVLRAHLGQMQVAYGLSGDAVASVRGLKVEREREARVLNAIGSVHTLTGHEDDAQPWFEQAAKLEPDNFMYRFNVAQGNVHLGRLEPARAQFASILERWPDKTKVRWAISTIGGITRARNQVESLQRELASCERGSLDEVFLQHALFIEFDALDEVEPAWNALARGMQAQRRRLEYDTRAEAQAALQLVRAAEQLARQPLPDRKGGPLPIFVLGLPRSGTTVIERVLTNHPDVAQGGELMDFAATLRENLGIESRELIPPSLIERLDRCDLAAAGRRYLDLTVHKRGRQRAHTDKLPFNYQLVPWILHALPDARVVHMVRDPVDTCFSNLKQLFTRNYQACYDPVEMADYYARYRYSMDKWQRLFPGRVHDVGYEALVTDPEPVSADLLAFCDLSPKAGVSAIEANLKPVATASTAQVRQPISRKSVGAWRKYERWLGPLIDRLRMHGHRPLT